MSRSNLHVLISGAGVCGPTLAWLPSRIGARVTVVEKNRSLLAQGQNIDIEGAAVSIVKMMGLHELIRGYNTTEKSTRFLDRRGRPFAALPVGRGRISPTSELEILRGDLAVVLYQATKTDPNVDYLFDTTVKEVVTNDEPSVRVELSNGEVNDYDLLVAADGQWSNVRRLCFPTEAVSVIDKDMYVSYFTVPRISDDDDWWNIYSASGARLISRRPDPHGTIRAMFSIMPCCNAQRQPWIDASRGDKKSQQDLVRSQFAGAGWQTDRFLSEMSRSPDYYLQPIQQVKMDRWSRSRVVCVGDAAYAPSPLTGSGAKLAMIGAYVLAGELSELKDGESPTKALEAYESKFRPFVEQVQEIPSFLPGTIHAKSAWGIWLFQTAISVFSRIASLSFVRSRIGAQDPETNDDGFPLPYYSSFAGEECKAG